MATLRGLHLLAGRALVDYEFRALLQSDPRAAARQVNVRLTDADVARIQALPWSKATRTADQLGQILPRSAAAWGGLVGPRPVDRTRATTTSRSGGAKAASTSRATARGAASAAKPKTTASKSTTKAAPKTATTRSSSAAKPATGTRTASAAKPATTRGSTTRASTTRSSSAAKPKSTGAAKPRSSGTSTRAKRTPKS